MIMLINDPVKIREIGKSGKEFAKSKYDVNKINKRIMEITGLIDQ
jgi:hypothetical protein